MIRDEAAKSASGIAPTHLPAFYTVAKTMNVWIMVRNVNKLCTSLIEHGYPTKGMSVHGKSADWGPQAGLICVNQELSKYQGKARVPALNAEVEHSLHHGMQDVKATPLITPKWRLDELERLGLVNIKWTFAQLGHGRYEKQGTITCPGRPHSFLAVPTPSGTGNFAISVRLNNQGSGEVVKVLARTRSLTGSPMTQTEGELPLTADYDLFNVCPSFQDLDLGGDDKFQNARGDLPQINRFALNHGIKKVYEAPQALDMGTRVQRLTSSVNPEDGRVKARYENALRASQNHQVRGHISIRQNLVRQRLNGIINSSYKGGDTVHHGAETMNPFPEADDFGITVFTPTGWTFGVENLIDLNDAYHKCREAGYYFHTNPAWGWKPLGRDRHRVMEMNVSNNVHSRS